jgi:uncharacterized membrane protein YvlD (DUF360 family)
MTLAARRRLAAASRRRLGFYQLQARLIWEWRPTRLAILRRTVLTFLVACLALTITAAVLPGLSIDGLGPLLLAALLLVALDSLSSVMLHWLLVRWPIFVAQALGLVIQIAAILMLGRIVPGAGVDSPTTAVWAAVLLTVLNSLFAELVAVSDDDSYYGVLVRRLVARDYGRVAEATPGLLVVQIDGLSLPILRNALRAGRAPVLEQLVRHGGATLHPWTASLPATTPASQAGILHGRTDGIPGFRWYEKASARLMVSNSPADAAEIVRRVSDGAGLLADDGASIGNLVTGDAPRSYLTMATIAQGASADDERRMRGFFVTTVNYIRLLVLMVGEVAKELYQAERQRGRSVEPRMRRGLQFAVERAVSNIALRTVSTALVIEEMHSRAPTIYVDYTGYDAIAHHSGPERAEAIDALDGIDRAIGSLVKASRYAGREYHLVVLSDHGQSQGATFQQRHGQPLEAVIAEQLPDAMTVVGTTDAVESAGMGRRITAELGRWSRVGSLLARRVPPRHGPSGDGTGLDATTARPDVVVCSSGSLAHVYFTSSAGHMTAEAMEAHHPGLIGALARHPGIGALLVRSADGHALAQGADGQHDLTDDRVDGTDPLAVYGPLAAEDLRRLERYPNSGDLILLGAMDQDSGEVTGFEELVGSHGGLGGWQTEPFLLCPASMSLTAGPLIGAPAVYRQLTAWQAQLSGDRGVEERGAGQDAGRR